MSKASDNVFPRFLISEGGSTATPASGNVTVYAKANGLLYSKDDAGAETALGGGGGGGSSRPYIDTLTLHATYGDDFTGALDTGKWTRRTVTSGEETTGTGGATWMDVDLSSAAASRLYLQTAPAGDFEIILSYAQWSSTTGHMVGPVIIDSAGAGVAAFPYDSSVLMYLGVLSAYAYASFPTSLYMPTVGYLQGQEVWVGLKKSGTAYSVRYSTNGYVWTPYSATTTQAFTVDRIGFGRVYGSPTSHRMSVDRFNVI